MVIVILIITLGAVFLGVIAGGTVVLFKKSEKAQRIAEAVAGVGAVGLEQFRMALVDDNGVDKEEAQTIFKKMLEQVKKEITDAANGE